MISTKEDDYVVEGNTFTILAFKKQPIIWNVRDKKFFFFEIFNKFF